jgi:hypothetical protein
MAADAATTMRLRYAVINPPDGLKGIIAAWCRHAYVPD